MIFATRHGNAEVRMAEFGSSSIPPFRGLGLSHAGERVDLSSASSIPAVTAAIRLVSETLASFYLGVFEGRNAARRERLDTWQADLLDRPFAEMSRFNWKADLAAAVESCGNALAYKAKVNGKVAQLVPLDPDFCVVRRDRETGEKLIDVRVNGGRQTFSTADVLHIRGFTLKGGVAGLSPIALHRHSLGAALALDRFEGKHFQNDASPGVIITFPEKVTPEQAAVWKSNWAADHAGGDNTRKTSVIGGGADVKSFPISLADAQFIESRGFSVEEVARMFRVPAALLDHSEQSETLANAEQMVLRFLTLSLRPRLINMEDALKNDPDLFGATTLYPEFVTDSMAAVDAKSRAAIDHARIQSGAWLKDEIRAAYGLPPLPDGVGMVPLETPVGAAPNAEVVK